MIYVVLEAGTPAILINHTPRRPLAAGASWHKF